MSKIEVDAIEPQSGTSLTLGASGDTITIPSGTTITNSGTATGFGKLLQVVTATDTTNRTTTSTTFVTASNTLSVTITPSSASNKIFLIANFSGSNNSSGYDSTYTIFRDATNLGTADGLVKIQNGTSDSIMNIAINYLDSPSSTSALTYQVYARSQSTGTTHINRGERSSLTAFEIAG
jgi:hypothetical protein